MIHVQAEVPPRIWQALATLHEYIAGHGGGNLDDVNAHNAFLRAEVAHLRCQINNDSKRIKKELLQFAITPKNHETCSSALDPFKTNGRYRHSFQLDAPTLWEATGERCVRGLPVPPNRVASCTTNAHKLELPPPSKPDDNFSEDPGFAACPKQPLTTPSEAYDPLTKLDDISSSSSRLSPEEPTYKQMSIQSALSEVVSGSLYPCWEVYDVSTFAEFDSRGSYLNCNSVSHSPASHKHLMPSLRRSTLARRVESCLVLDPDSRFRLAWDLATLFLLAYDCIMVPLQLFDLRETDVLRTIAYIGACFWTMDIAASACTGFYRNGVLVAESSTILRRYLSTWFLFDIFVVSLDWATLAMSLSSLVGSMRVLRLLRFVRLLKLLRLFKLDAIFRKFCERFYVGIHLVLLLRLIGLMIGGLIFTHFLSCIWYALGNSSSNGWAEQLGDSQFWYIYFSSFHWALTCFHSSSEIHPRTAAERGFACAIVSFAFVAVTYLQSLMTQMMVQMHTLSKAKIDQTEDLQKFFAQRKVATPLRHSIWSLIKHKERHVYKLEKQVALLQTLPKGLQMDLHAEMMAPILLLHSFFSNLRDEFPRAVRQICHEALHDYIPYENETFFVKGDACGEMYIVDRGNLEYTLVKDSTKSYLRHGQFACEGALWMQWNNCGSLVADSSSCLLYKVVSEKFRQVFPAHREAHVKTCYYARVFLQHVKDNGRSDLHANCYVSLPLLR